MGTKPSKVVLQKNPPRLEDLDMGAKLTPKAYQLRLPKLQKRLMAIQQAYYRDNRRAIIVFEGWDASGKGGAIRRLTERMDPRGYSVHPISAPNELELKRHYLWRFAYRNPSHGGISIFDRSYYGRVLVERIEGFATKQEWQRAYHEINWYENLLMDDGVRFVKIFLHITPEEQLKRFSLRLHNPIKRWKLTEEDLRNRAQWNAYHKVYNKMFKKTSTEAAPWHLIAGNYKWYARVQTLQVVADALEEGVDITPPPLDEALVEAAEEKLGIKVRRA